MKKITALLFILMISCQICSAAFERPDPSKWQYLGDKPTIEVWMDKDTIKFSKGPDGTLANVWSMNHIKEDDKKELYNWEINLDKRQYRLISKVVYNAYGVGRVIPSNQEKFWPIDPESLAEEMFKLALKAYSQSKNGKQAA